MTLPVPATRDEAAALLLEVLTTACPEGEVGLIGSMATPEEADAFSDIDIRWTIPPDQASAQLQSLRLSLQQVGTIESLRVDPDPRPDMRLVFARFQGWPLLWRVDLEIHCPGLGSVGVPNADSWSPEESACMGVIVALKALARGRPAAAESLLARAVERAGATDAVGDWQSRIDSLLAHIETRSPSTAHLAGRTRQLSRDVFGGPAR